MGDGELTGDLRVLVVDDEADIRYMLRPYLSSEGWQVDEATSGSEALGLCRDAPPDILVLDYKMPDLTGMQVARRLLEARFPSPIIIFSAYLRQEIETEAASLGISAIDKADLPGLVDRIKELTS